MAGRTLAQITGNLFADALALFGIPASTGLEAFNRYLTARSVAARDTLFEELRAGNIDALQAANEDEVIAVIYRYALAVRDGSARRNIRLLAKIMVGLKKRDRLYSDEFNRYADVLARLTRDQMLVLGRYTALYREEQTETPDSERARIAAWSRLIKELVPSEFASNEDILYICGQCSGRGLIITSSAFSTLVHRPSPLMHEIAELADFEDVLEAECEAGDPTA